MAPVAIGVSRAAHRITYLLQCQMSRYFSPPCGNCKSSATPRPAPPPSRPAKKVARQKRFWMKGQGFWRKRESRPSCTRPRTCFSINIALLLPHPRSLWPVSHRCNGSVRSILGGDPWRVFPRRARCVVYKYCVPRVWVGAHPRDAGSGRDAHRIHTNSINMAARTRRCRRAEFSSGHRYRLCHAIRGQDGCVQSSR